MEKKEQKSRILFPIGAKLVIIITILLLVSLGAVIIMVSALSTQEVQKTAEDNNFTVNRRAGSQAEIYLSSIKEAVILYLEMMDWLSSENNRNPDMEGYFFNHNRSIAAIGISEPGKEGVLDTYIPNIQFLELNGISAAGAETYLSSNNLSAGDYMQLFNASPFFQFNLLTAVFIHHGRNGDETVKVLFTPDDLSETFGTGTNTSFLLNNSGNLLLHPDNDLVLGGANFSSLPIVAIMQQQGDSNRQVSYTYGEEKYFGAYYRLDEINAVVITTIPQNIVFEAIQSITRQNIFLTGAVLFIAILFIWIFSKTISRPVRTLADAAVQIEKGNFDYYLKPQTRDELGLLTESFNNMSRALNIFGRFTNKGIAVRAMRGEIKPGGLPRHATIFFSDIRSFTEKTENFTTAYGEDAPNRVVLWLNEYFTHMIQCVEDTGGVVDKFIGDALMAHWGTGFTAGNPTKDAYNSVKAALMMREALIKLNSKRAENDTGNPVINIGCGINTGMVIAGQIGSEQRMEYTVIGDPVNLASRIESLNKLFGTDILITENTWSLIADDFITEEMLPVTVKGKENPVRVFAVVNFKNAGGPQTLAEVRDLLGINPPDFNELNIDEEEKKYSVSKNKNSEKEENTSDLPEKKTSPKKTKTAEPSEKIKRKNNKN